MVKVLRNFYSKGQKTVWGKGKKLISAFSPFPKMFSKAIFLKGFKTRDCVVRLMQKIYVREQVSCQM